MADVVTPEVRSRMMSGIRGRDTKPELLLRRGLHKAGFRFRLHAATLPGRPDLIFPKHQAVLFTHGCFWHMHNCPMFRWPSTREEFWRQKITRNRERDEFVLKELERLGWRIGVVWECAVMGRGRLPITTVISRCCDWLRSNKAHLELSGKHMQPSASSKQQMSHAS